MTEKRKKIIYIIGQLGRGGAERQFFELLNGINKKKYKPIVVSLSQGSTITDDATMSDYWAKRIKGLGLEVIQLQRNKHREFSRIIKLIKILRREKPHIIHSYLTSANTYGRIAALFTRIPIIIASERSSYEVGVNKSKYGIYLDKMLSCFSSAIICNSHKASSMLINKHKYKNEKVHTIHNGIEIRIFSERYNQNKKINNGAKTIGMVANHSRVKNYKLFLDAVDIVISGSGNKDINILAVGDGPLKEESIEYSNKLGIKSKVKFVRATTDEIPKFLHRMDVFILSSNYEGLSNAIMEAMAAGLPCVVTDVGGNSELVIDGKTGYIVPPYDPDALAYKVLHLLNNNRLAKKFGSAGQKLMRKEFSLEKMVMNTEKIYEELANIL